MGIWNWLFGKKKQQQVEKEEKIIWRDVKHPSIEPIITERYRGKYTNRANRKSDTSKNYRSGDDTSYVYQSYPYNDTPTSFSINGDDDYSRPSEDTYSFGGYGGGESSGSGAGGSWESSSHSDTSSSDWSSSSDSSSYDSGSSDSSSSDSGSSD